MEEEGKSKIIRGFVYGEVSERIGIMDRSFFFALLLKFTTYCSILPRSELIDGVGGAIYGDLQWRSYDLGPQPIILHAIVIFALHRKNKYLLLRHCRCPTRLKLSYKREVTHPKKYKYKKKGEQGK